MIGASQYFLLYLIDCQISLDYSRSRHLSNLLNTFSRSDGDPFAARCKGSNTRQRKERDAAMDPIRITSLITPIGMTNRKR